MRGTQVEALLSFSLASPRVPSFSLAYPAEPSFPTAVPFFVAESGFSAGDARLFVCLALARGFSFRFAWVER